MLSPFDETFRRMQMMADQVRWDVEKTLNRNFNTWDLLDFNVPFDEKNDFFRMKIRTDDNGHVKIKTIEKEPGKPEKVQVEEYDRGTKALEQKPGEKGMQVSKSPETKEVSEVKEFKDSFNEIQKMADNMKKDIESSLGRTFGTWNLMDYSYPMDPEKSYVRMKIKTDDNGHVRVKTAEKEPGKPWDIKIEDYDKGGKGKAMEQESRGAIKQGMETTQGQKQNIESAHQA